MNRNFVAAKFLGKAPVEAARAWVAQISEVGVRDATPGLPWPCSMGKPSFKMNKFARVVEFDGGD